MFYNCLAAPSQGRRNERVPLRVRAPTSGPGHSWRGRDQGVRHDKPYYGRFLFAQYKLCVRSCDDLLKAVIHVPCRRQADADRHANGGRTLLQRFSRNSGAQPFGDAQCVVGGRHRQHDGEFLAPDAPYQVGLPQPGAQAVDDVL